MTSRTSGRVTSRWWALAALGALVVVAAGLVQVVVGSRREVLQVLVGTVLSLAVMAATAWWAFTTRRVWKRWLNLAIAVLAVANVVLGFLEFGLRQAAGATAILAGSLAYAACARRALRPKGPSAGSGAPGEPVGAAWLVVNPRSGDGKAGRVGLVEAARARGLRVHVLERGEDLVALAREAVAAGAGTIGVAGGDGSLGLVAKVAVEAGVPFVCVPAGTRNHFAGDLGLDRGDPVAALEAFAGPERRIDVGMVGERMFLNNVSLGAYADVVADPRYRAAKLATAHAVLPASLRGEQELLQVGLRDAEGREHPDVLVLLVASNSYELNGTRERLDGGLLQVSALRARTGAALAGLATRALARGRLGGGGGGWAQWTTTTLAVSTSLPHLPAGVDGEALTLPTPLEFRVLPGALRVLVPPTLGPPASRVQLHRWATVRRLARAAAGSVQPG